jgi:hypothetical protein
MVMRIIERMENGIRVEAGFYDDADSVEAMMMRAAAATPQRRSDLAHASRCLRRSREATRVPKREMLIS